MVKPSVRCQGHRSFVLDNAIRRITSDSTRHCMLGLHGRFGVMAIYQDFPYTIQKIRDEFYHNLRGYNA